MSSCKIIAALAIVVLVAACGKLPRPFKPDDNARAVSPLVELTDSAAVIVAPIELNIAGTGAELSQVVAAELRRANVPATTEDVLTFAYTLYGKAHPTAPDKNIVVEWSLTDHEGNVVLHDKTSSAPPRPDDLLKSTLTRVARDSAQLVASTLQAGRPATADPSQTTLGVVAVTGAPGDGNRSLRTAFEAVLRRAGLPVVTPPESATVHITGEVTATPRADGAQELTIVWRLRAADGRDLGELRQRNAIAGDKIESKWGLLAYDVTYAMVDSIGALFEEIDRVEAIRRQAQQ